MFWNGGTRLFFSKTDICTYNNPVDFKDEYNGAGAVVRSNKKPDKSGFIKAWGYDTNDESFIFPSTVGGSETTYVTDYYGNGNFVNALCVSGEYNEANRAGQFHVYTGNMPGNAASWIGSRLQKLPQST